MAMADSRLIGRDAELVQLRARWQCACDGQGQVVLIDGEAGIGKSRLVHGFANELNALECFEFRYQCSPHLTNSAFHPIVASLKRAAKLTVDDSSHVALNKLEQMIAGTTNDPSAVVPLFASLLSIPFESRYGALDLTPAQLRFRTIEALIDQGVSLSRRKPLLVVLEDAHWIDPSMKDFVTELMTRIVDQAALMLITYRPENAPAWPNQPHVTELNLGRLEKSQAATIAHAVGGSALLNTIVERIVLRAEGVPLYIEELTKSTLEGFFDEDGTATNALVPATLQSSLVARLDRLGPATRVAQIAAVIGREFDQELLTSVSLLKANEVESALERLVESGLVLARDSSLDGRYTFKHALVRDAAYSTIEPARRRELHQRVVAFLEQRFAQPSDEQIDVLAHHATQAELWHDAFDYLQRSGRRAIDRAAIREAVAQFEQALRVGAHLPESTASIEHAIDLRFDLRNALWSIGEFEQILAHLSEAEQRVRALNDPVRSGWISVFRSASYWQLGRTEQALQAAEEALAISDTADDLSLWVGANFYLGCAYVTSGDCHRAETYFGKIVDALNGDMRYERCGLPFVPAVIARSWLVWALAERGEFERGQASCR